MRKQNKLINLAYSSPRYWGKHIIIIAGKIFSARTGKTASKLLEKLLKKFPEEVPTITYIPKAEALILFLNED